MEPACAHRKGGTDARNARSCAGHWAMGGEALLVQVARKKRAVGVGKFFRWRC